MSIITREQKFKNEYFYNFYFNFITSYFISLLILIGLYLGLLMNILYAINMPHIGLPGQSIWDGSVILLQGIIIKKETGKYIPIPDVIIKIGIISSFVTTFVIMLFGLYVEELEFVHHQWIIDVFSIFSLITLMSKYKIKKIDIFISISLLISCIVIGVTVGL